MNKQITGFFVGSCLRINFCYSSRGKVTQVHFFQPLTKVLIAHENHLKKGKGTKVHFYLIFAKILISLNVTFIALTYAKKDSNKILALVSQKLG